MDVTFVLEESGATATVDVPCDANVAEAKRVACTEFAVSPASVEVRVGTEVVEGTCRLQDTAIGTGVQVVLACPTHVDVRCPAEYTLPEDTSLLFWTLSQCGRLGVVVHTDSTNRTHYVVGFDTQTFETEFRFKFFIYTSGTKPLSTPAISRCTTRLYVAQSAGYLSEVALPSGDVLRHIIGPSEAVLTCGRVVVSRCKDSVSVYDEDLTLLRSLAHTGCSNMAASTCGKWLMTSSSSEEVLRLWDVDTGLAVACVSGEWLRHSLALCPPAGVFFVSGRCEPVIYSWSGDNIGVWDDYTDRLTVLGMQFTPCGEYIVIMVISYGHDYARLYQYNLEFSEVHEIPDVCDVGHNTPFIISPCSRVIIFEARDNKIVSRPLYPFTE